MKERIDILGSCLGSCFVVSVKISYLNLYFSYKSDQKDSRLDNLFWCHRYNNGLIF